MRFLFVLFILISSLSIKAQDEDTQGKDFWVTFMPNAHVGAFNTDILRIRDSLYLFIASNLETNVYFEYRDRRGVEHFDTIYIDDIFKYFTFKIPYWDYELHDYVQIGDNRWGGISDNVGKIAPQSFHITSEEPITVIAHNQARWSSDGMIVYPTERLGTKYFTQNYNGFDDRSPQFAIVATEDNTSVLIEPSSKVYYFDEDDYPIEIELDRGDVFLLQADMSAEFNPDLSGSYVEADKPIAVFSGNERAMIPYFSELSKDCLLGQMIPLESNGIEYIIFPPVNAFESVQSSQYNDIYRVVAFYDDTEIYANDELVATINRGEVYEGDITEPIYLLTTSTVSVSQIKKSTSTNGVNGWGDPFMLLNPAVEQYFTSYKVINFQASEFQSINFALDVYEVHYVSLIARSEFKDNILYDFNPLPDTLTWELVPGTDWEIAHLQSELGTHVLTSDTTFGCFTYGYGEANSYGFVGGGMKLKKLDHERPVIQGFNECNYLLGSATDSTEFDSGIDRIEVTPNSSNLSVSYDPIDSARSVEFRVDLLDPYVDGIGQIAVYDEFGISKKYDIAIPGFTLNIQGSGNNVIDENPDLPGLPAIRRFCFRYNINNYGNYEQIITEARTSSPEFTVSTPLPIVLQPSESVEIEVCFFSNDVEGTFSDSLIISDGCTDRKLVQYDITAWTDIDEPRISDVDVLDCDERIFRVLINDDGEFDFGLESVEYNLDNIIIEEQVETFPSNASYLLKVDDVLEDSYYEFTAIDSSGNETLFTKEIPGFTLTIDGERPGTKELNFNENMIGSVICDSLELTNTGSYEMNFEYGEIEVNKLFSIPSTQFPIVIQPGESIWFKFCYSPVEIREVEDLDSMKLNFNECLSTVILLKGQAVEFDTESNTRCNLTLNIQASEIPNKAFLEAPFPNPSSNQIEFTIGLSDLSQVDGKLFDLNGNKVLDIYSGTIPEGIHQMIVDLNDISNGGYIYSFSIGGNITSGSIIISK